MQSYSYAYKYMYNLNFIKLAAMSKAAIDLNLARQNRGLMQLFNPSILLTSRGDHCANISGTLLFPPCSIDTEDAIATMSAQHGLGSSPH